MKPQGINNIQLETPQEALAASEAFTFAAGGDDNPYGEVFPQVADGLFDHAARWQRDHGGDPEAKYSFIFEGHMAEIAETVIRVAGEVHPDPETRAQIAALTASYQENVFNAAMSPTPPPDDQPPQYRSPFGE